MNNFAELTVEVYGVNPIILIYCLTKILFYEKNSLDDDCNLLRRL